MWCRFVATGIVRNVSLATDSSGSKLPEWLWAGEIHYSILVLRETQRALHRLLAPSQGQRKNSQSPEQTMVLGSSPLLSLALFATLKMWCPTYIVFWLSHHQTRWAISLSRCREISYILCKNCLPSNREDLKRKRNAPHFFCRLLPSALWKDFLAVYA